MATEKSPIEVCVSNLPKLSITKLLSKATERKIAEEFDKSFNDSIDKMNSNYSVLVANDYSINGFHKDSVKISSWLWKLTDELALVIIRHEIKDTYLSAGVFSVQNDLYVRMVKIHHTYNTYSDLESILYNNVITTIQRRYYISQSATNKLPFVSDLQKMVIVGYSVNVDHKAGRMNFNFSEPGILTVTFSHKNKLVRKDTYQHAPLTDIHISDLYLRQVIGKSFFGKPKTDRTVHISNILHDHIEELIVRAVYGTYEEIPKFGKDGGVLC